MIHPGVMLHTLRLLHPTDDSAYNVVKTFNFSQSSLDIVDNGRKLFPDNKIYYYKIEETQPVKGYSLKTYINNEGVTFIWNNLCCESKRGKEKPSV